MNHSGVKPDRRAPAVGIVPKALLLAAFAVAMFLAGRLWSLREVREAQRQAGLAEKERLAFQAELTECRNALLLLQRERVEVSSEFHPKQTGDHTSRVRTAVHSSHKSSVHLFRNLPRCECEALERLQAGVGFGEPVRLLRGSTDGTDAGGQGDGIHGSSRK